MMAEQGEQFATRVIGRRRGGGLIARVPFRRIDQRLDRARFRADTDQIAVAQLADRTTAQRFGRQVDRGRHLAARAGHAPIGQQRDLEAAILQHAERRGQLVQFRHAVGARTLEADDDHDIALQFTRLEGAKHIVLVLKDGGGRLGGPTLRIHGAHLHDAAAEIALQQLHAAIGLERVGGRA